MTPSDELCLFPGRGRSAALALRGLKPLKLDELSEDEQDDFLDQLADLDANPTPARDAFYSERRRRGLGVGLDDTGNIVKRCT